MLIECHMYLLFLSRYNFFYFLFALLFLYEHRELLTFWFIHFARIMLIWTFEKKQQMPFLKQKYLHGSTFFNEKCYWFPVASYNLMPRFPRIHQTIIPIFGKNLPNLPKFSCSTMSVTSTSSIKVLLLRSSAFEQHHKRDY